MLFASTPPPPPAWGVDGLVAAPPGGGASRDPFPDRGGVQGSVHCWVSPLPSKEGQRVCSLVCRRWAFPGSESLAMGCAWSSVVRGPGPTRSSPHTKAKATWLIWLWMDSINWRSIGRHHDVAPVAQSLLGSDTISQSVCGSNPKW